MDDPSRSASTARSEPAPFGDADRIATVTLDPYTITSINPEAEHEWRVAIDELVEQNRFRPDKVGVEGPFALHLSIMGNYIMLDIRAADTFEPVAAHYLSLSPFSGLIRDYFRIRDAYFAAVRSNSTFQIEAVDMGRRGLHNDAADLLITRLNGKVAMDHETARRLFTLICAVQPYAARIDPRDATLPLVLFVCSMNAVRSPMAAALARRAFPAEIIARSAGVRSGMADGFVHQVMDELSIDMSVHTPHTLDELATLKFDLVVPMSEEAADAVAARRIASSSIERWDVPDPSREDGSRDQRLAAYRTVRNLLDQRVRDRLAALVSGSSQSV
ncbi:MAG: UPF0262 family protein [Alphaproteobacteria bacterium]|nr:UPF0262 family protein [Alphaproteobacteria bacterium]